MIKAAEKHSDVDALVRIIIEQMRERERKRVIDFDSDSGDVWYEVNIRYRKLSGSKQYDMAGDVYDTVVDTINDIVKKCGPLASAQTRFNGLSVLRKIGKTIVLSSIDAVGHEVQKEFEGSNELEDGMLKILNSMQSEEIDAIRFDKLSDEALWPTLLDFHALAQGYCVFEKLDDVRKKGRLGMEGGLMQDYGHMMFILRRRRTTAESLVRYLAFAVHYRIETPPCPTLSFHQLHLAFNLAFVIETVPQDNCRVATTAQCIYDP